MTRTCIFILLHSILAKAENALNRLDGILVEDGLIELVHHGCKSFILAEGSEVRVFLDLHATRNISKSEPATALSIRRSSSSVVQVHTPWQTTGPNTGFNAHLVQHE